MGKPKRKELERRKREEQAPKAGQMIAQTSESDIIEALKGKTIIGVLEPAFDCCTEKCILEYLPYFATQGYGFLCVPQPAYQDLLKYMSSYVILFRAGYQNTDPSLLASLVAYVKHLRALGIRVVYYADDFIFLMNNKAPLTLASNCNAVIVANETLKNYLINQCKFTMPIIVIRTHVDLPAFDKLEKITFPDFKGRVKILFSSGGRIGINHIYEICEKANDDPSMYNNIQWLFNASEVAQIRSVINKFRNLHKTYLDWMPLKDYYCLFKSTDIVVHPARNDDLAYMVPPEYQEIWLDSKCEVKYTLAGAGSNPIIASPKVPYKAAIQHGVNGLLATTAEEFVTFIKLLVDSPKLRDELGETARKDVEARYDIKVRYPEYLAAIIGQLDAPALAITQYVKRDVKTVFIPEISEGGPRSFYENMKRWLPIVSNSQWEVTEDLSKADIAIAVAFVLAEIIIEEKKKRGMPIIYRLDGLPMNFEGILDPSNLEIMRGMFRYTDHLVWQSQHCKKMWTERLLIPEDYLPGSKFYEGTIIHNGVDTQIFSPDGEKYSLPTNRINVLNVNWSTFKHKRLDLLIDIINACQKREEEDDTFPKLQFYTLGNYIINSGPLQCMKFWQDFKNVTYLGAIRNQSEEAKKMLASVYRANKFLLFTSEMEGSPNTILEATACGLPTYYNKAVDIVPEICGDACLGFASVEEFMGGLGTMLSGLVHPVLKEEFTIESCAKKYLEVLEETWTHIKQP